MANIPNSVHWDSPRAGPGEPHAERWVQKPDFGEEPPGVSMPGGSGKQAGAEAGQGGDRWAGQVGGRHRLQGWRASLDPRRLWT